MNDYLKQHSEFSASRNTTQIRYSEKVIKPNGVIEKQTSSRKFENSRYLDNNLTELHKDFHKEKLYDYEIIPSKSTFMRYKSKIFKRAKRKTDLCM